MGVSELQELRQRAAAAATGSAGPGEGEVVVQRSELEELRQKAVDAAVGLSRMSGVDPGFTQASGDGGGDRAPFQLPVVQRQDRQCALCHRTFATAAKLRRHLAGHLGENAYECTQCGKGLASKQSLDTHRKTCGVDKTFVCPIEDCRSLFASQVLLTDHARVHQTLPVQEQACACGATFTKLKSKKEHWTNCPANPDRKGPYFCPVDDCPLKRKRHEFRRMKNLNTHLRTAHEHNPKKPRA